MESSLFRYYESPLGILVLGERDGRLCLCDWPGRVKLPEGCKEGTSELIERASAQLNEYFEGKRRQFDVRTVLSGTDFQMKVWNELLAVPYGETVSYGELACRIGMPKAVRVVANAVGANMLSIFVPCHRVIGSDSSLTGYRGGLDVKLKLLRLEGILF